MSRLQDIPFIGGAYSDDTRPWSVQDTQNYILVPSERPGTRSAGKLVGVPGLVPFCAGMEQAPVRGLHDVEGKLLAVAGRTLYEITRTAVAIPIGTIPGTARVSMTHNKLAVGNEVLIANGQSGYVYNTYTGAFGQVTDDGFAGFKICDFVDDYIAGVEPQGRFWAHSNLRAAGDYNTLDRYDSESSPDKMVSLIVSHREVMVLNERSSAFFRNTGAATGTFANSNGMEIEVGCAATFAVARLDNSIFWLGNDGIVYRLNGHSPQRISTGPIEQAISRCDMSKAFAFTFEDRGHKVFYLTLVDGQTWGFDVWSGEWHRRQSKGLNRWRVDCLTKWQGQWIAGDFTNGRLYRLDWSAQHEVGEKLERLRVGPPVHDSQNRVTMNGAELVMNTGVSEPVVTAFPVQPNGPSITGAAPSGAVGIAYAGYQYTVTPGGAPIASVRIVSGALPSGLSMSNAGLIDTGTPTELADFPITVRVTDTNGLYADLDDVIGINTVFFIAETGVSPLFVSGGGESWLDSNTSVTGLATQADLLYSASGRIYAIGAGGEGRYSNNSGATWASVSGLQTTSQIAGMTYTGSRWVAINASTSGGARISTDGITFTPSAFVTDRTVRDISSNGATVIVTTTASVVIRSTDGGATWSEYVEASLSGTPLIRFGGGLFVAAFVNEGKIATSPTGAAGTWTLRTDPSVNGAAGLAYGNGVFVLTTTAGEVLTSADGITWALSANLGILSPKLAYGPSVFVAVGSSGSIHSSSDGLTWAATARPSTMGTPTAVGGVVP